MSGHKGRAFGIMKEAAGKIARLIGKAAGFVQMIPIRFYQVFISPGLPPVCKYYPSCSHYAIQAIKTHGAVKGLLLAVWRILRCNPWSRGGVDYVPRRFDLLYYRNIPRENFGNKDK